MHWLGRGSISRPPVLLVRRHATRACSDADVEQVSCVRGAAKSSAPAPPLASPAAAANALRSGSAWGAGGATTHGASAPARDRAAGCDGTAGRTAGCAALRRSGGEAALAPAGAPGADAATACPLPSTCARTGDAARAPVSGVSVPCAPRNRAPASLTGAISPPILRQAGSACRRCWPRKVKPCHCSACSKVGGQPGAPKPVRRLPPGSSPAPWPLEHPGCGQAAASRPLPPRVDAHSCCPWRETRTSSTVWLWPHSLNVASGRPAASGRSVAWGHGQACCLSP